MNAEPPSRPPPLEDPEIERRARERRLARGLHVAARRALALARRYRDEEGARGARETTCVKQALAWREAARHLRAGIVNRPGLVRTSASTREASRRAG